MSAGVPPPEEPSPRGPDLDPASILSASRTPSRKGCLGRGGCGMGCLVLTVLILIGMASFMGWLVAEARIPLAESLVGQETVAFTIVHLSDDDPGVRALLHSTMRQLRRTFIDRGTLPEPAKQALSKLAQQNHPFLPAQMVVTYDVLPKGGAAVASGSGAPSAAPSPTAAPSTIAFGAASPTSPPSSTASGAPSRTAAAPSPSTAPVATLVLSFGRFKGLSEVMFRSIVSAKEEGSQLMTYRDAEILVVPPRHPGDVTAIGRLENSFVFSPRVEGVQLAIDRLTSASGGFGGRSGLAEMYARLDARQDLVGVVTSDDGQIRRFLESMAAGQDPKEGGAIITPAFIDVAAEAVQRIGWEMDILSQNEVSLRALLECRGPAEAAQVKAFLEQLGRESKQAKLTDSTRVNVSGSKVEATFQTSRLQNLFAEDDREPEDPQDP